MDKARQHLEKSTNGDQESQLVTQLSVIPPHRPHLESSFYEYFILRGIRVHRFQPGSFSCSFRVPPRLTDSDGNLATGAVASLVDALGAAVIYKDKGEETAANVSVDMSISYVSTAKINDELEVTSRCLGKQGQYFGTNVLIQNKTTGKIVAEGRHSLFSISRSKM